MTLLDFYYIVLLIALTSGFIYRHIVMIYEGTNEFLGDKSFNNPLVVLEDIYDNKELHILFRILLAILVKPIIWFFGFGIEAFSRYFWKKLYRKIVDFLM